MSFFFNAPATTEIYTLSLHDALPISHRLAHGSQAAKAAAQPRRHHVGQSGDHGRRRPAPHDRDQQGDRKSTRLNSSHTVISYAVFCLKKKKKKTNKNICIRRRTKTQK